MIARAERLTDLAWRAVSAVLRPGDWAVDATLGNGHDCLFLAERVGAVGRVFGFDVQDEALRASRCRLETAGLLERVTLVHAGHEQMRACLPEGAAGRVGAGMFNLGYLPGGDKRTVTRPATTLAAVEQGFDLLRPGGLISLLIYVGHAGGPEELQALQNRLPQWQSLGVRLQEHRGSAARSPVLWLLTL